MNDSTPAPNSPNEKAVLEEIRLKLIEITKLADQIEWDWELSSRPLGGKRRMAVVATEKKQSWKTQP